MPWTGGSYVHVGLCFRSNGQYSFFSSLCGELLWVSTRSPPLWSHTTLTAVKFCRGIPWGSCWSFVLLMRRLRTRYPAFWLVPGILMMEPFWFSGWLAVALAIIGSCCNLYLNRSNVFSMQQLTTHFLVKSLLHTTRRGFDLLGFPIGPAAWLYTVKPLSRRGSIRCKKCSPGSVIFRTHRWRLHFYILPQDCVCLWYTCPSGLISQAWEVFDDLTGETLSDVSWSPLSDCAWLKAYNR